MLWCENPLSEQTIRVGDSKRVVLPIYPLHTLKERRKLVDVVPGEEREAGHQKFDWTSLMRWRQTTHAAKTKRAQTLRSHAEKKENGDQSISAITTAGWPVEVRESELACLLYREQALSSSLR